MSCDHSSCAAQDGRRGTLHCPETGEQLATGLVFAVGHEWEHNGRDDSDWYQCGYDVLDGTIKRYEIGTTRWANGGVVTLPEPPPELQQRVKDALYRDWCRALVNSHFQAVEHPSEDRLAGRRVELKKDCYNRARGEVEVDCWKCSGRGYWQNPHKPEDQRKCFKCNGTKKALSSKPVKGQPMVLRAAGTQGKVIAIYANRSQFGTWDYGSRVVLAKDDGEVFKVAIDNIRLVDAGSAALPLAEAVSKIARRHSDDAYSLHATSALSMMRGSLLHIVG